MVLGWLGWFRSVENRHFAKFLFESKEWSGYWRQRWGDQPIWPRMLCMWFEFDSIENEKRVCDFTGWRDTYFEHY
jgi:hypothetical protein